MPSSGTYGLDRGYLIPIGGAESKWDDPVILGRFVDLCGRQEARIVVIPTASQLEDTGQRYTRILRELGVRDVIDIPVAVRADCERSDYLEALEHATGIFITGGNQLRLSTIMGGSPMARVIRRLNADGVHVAGTSAGAAIMPEHMIAGGDAGPTPTQDIVTLAPGLGLTNRLIIDQHFRERDRLGRLLAAVSYNPFVVGIGLDEDTALFIDPDGVFEVVGSGAVTVVDPTDLSYSSMGVVGPGEPVSLIGLKLHILADGCRFDTHSREASIKY